MRIAIVRVSRTIRGAETHAIALAAALARRGHEVVVVTREASPLVAMAEERGLHAVGLPIAGDLNVRAPGRMAQFLTQERIGVVNAHGSHGVLACCLGARRVGVPVVVTFHTPVQTTGRELGSRRGSALCRLRRPALLFASRIIAVSELSRRFLIAGGFPEDRVVAIKNGIELDRFPQAGLDDPRRSRVRAELGVPEEAMLFAFIGRLIGEKRPEWFVRALVQLRGELPVHGFIAGDGPLRPSLEASLAELGRPEWLRLLGFRTDTGDLLAAADCLVAPSTREGLPIVFLEAMATGRPVIATDVGGVSELVVDGETGFQAPPDSQPALVDAMRRIAQDQSLRESLGLASRRRVEEEFTMEGNAERVEQVLMEALGDTFASPRSGGDPSLPM